MAHSTWVYRGKHVVPTDLDAWVFLYFLNDAVSTRATHPLDVEIKRATNFQFTWYAPGCIQLELDGLLKTDAERGRWCELLSEVETLAAACGGLLPADLINERLEGFGIWYGPNYPLTNLSTILIQLRTMTCPTPRE